MADLFFYFSIFLFGLIVGSFLNCVIYRLAPHHFSPKSGGGLGISKSFLKGRSLCPLCGHLLAWYDLIPVLSFLILKGKCRYCGKKISWQYPLVEIATGILFLLPLLSSPSFGGGGIRWGWEYLFYSLIASFLIIIFVYDLKHYIIPDKIIYPAIAITFLYQFFGHWDLGFHWSLVIGIWDFIWAAVLASGFFLAIVLISHGRAMGMGDVKLAFLMGLLLGWPNILVALFSAFFIGAIIGIGLIVAGKKTLKSEVPFGPFLVVGTFIAMFWAERIMNWYLSL